MKAMLRATLRTGAHLLLVSVACGSIIGAETPAPQGTIVLDSRTPVRCHFTWGNVGVKKASGELIYIHEAFGYKWGNTYQPFSVEEIEAKKTGKLVLYSSGFPPKDWAQPEFDDGSWARARPPVFSGDRELALLAARARFEVENPARVGELTLTLAYRGGAVERRGGRSR